MGSANHPKTDWREWMNYLKQQKNALVRSVKIPSVLTIALLEFVKYIALLLVLLSALSIFARLFLNVQPVLDILATIKATGMTDLLVGQFTNHSGLFIAFIIELIILIIISFAIIILISAFFDSKITSLMRKTTWTMQSFWRYVLGEAILTLLYGIIAFILIYTISSVPFLTFLLIVLTVIYAYLMLVFTATITDKKPYQKSVMQYLINVLHLHYGITPFCCSIILLAVLLVICAILALFLHAFILILFIPAIILWIIWSKHYMYCVYAT